MRHHRLPIRRAVLSLGGLLSILALPAAAQVTTYGSGVNPSGSLVVSSGSPLLGENFAVRVSNTAVALP